MKTGKVLNKIPKKVSGTPICSKPWLILVMHTYLAFWMVGTLIKVRHFTRPNNTLTKIIGLDLNRWS